MYQHFTVSKIVPPGTQVLLFPKYVWLRVIVIYNLNTLTLIN